VLGAVGAAAGFWSGAVSALDERKNAKKAVTVMSDARKFICPSSSGVGAARLTCAEVFSTEDHERTG
jgi:hypothetical protein